MKYVNKALYVDGTAQIITEYYFDIAYDAIRSLNTL